MAVMCSDTGWDVQDSVFKLQSRFWMCKCVFRLTGWAGSPAACLVQRGSLFI